MKKIGFIIVLLITAWAQSPAQPLNNIFNRDENMVWLGLDFTAAKLVGDRRAWGSPDRVHFLMTSMNNLLRNETDKYDIAHALNLRYVDDRIQITVDHNRRLNMESAVSDRLNGHFLDEHDIRQVIDTYDFEGLSGTGIIFVVESFNKPAMQSVVWATFVNLETKELLFARKMIEEPVGFGIRNFWSGSIYKMMKQIRKKDYHLWRREYAAKR